MMKNNEQNCQLVIYRTIDYLLYNNDNNNNNSNNVERELLSVSTLRVFGFVFLGRLSFISNVSHAQVFCILRGGLLEN